MSEINRRDFLKICGVVAGAAALPKWAMETEAGLPKPRLEGPVIIGNLYLDILSTEHARRDWEANKEFIIAIMQRYPVIIPEYFPPEYMEMKGSSDLLVQQAVSHYLEANYLFEPVADIAQSSGKEVWVLDPAYGKEFIFLREFLHIPQATVETSVGLNLLNRFFAATKKNMCRDPNLSEEQNEKRNKMFEVIIKSLWIAFGLGMASGNFTSTEEIEGGVDPAFKAEQDFRMVMVAEHLHQLGESVSKQTRALLIYPPAHVEKIKYYLKDDEVRKGKVKTYVKIIKKLPTFKRLFAARHYFGAAVQGGWIIDKGLEIE